MAASMGISSVGFRTHDLRIAAIGDSLTRDLATQFGNWVGSSVGVRGESLWTAPTGTSETPLSEDALRAGFRNIPGGRLTLPAPREQELCSGPSWMHMPSGMAFCYVYVRLSLGRASDLHVFELLHRWADILVVGMGAWVNPSRRNVGAFRLQ